MLIDLNDVVPLTATLTDGTGTLVDAGTVVCNILIPGGTTVTPTVTHPSTGVYTTTYKPPTPGFYVATWQGANGDDFGEPTTWVVRIPTNPRFAQPDDVAAGWRPLTAAELVTAPFLLDYASALIRARFPGIDSQVVSGAVDPVILLMVTAGMVKRALIAPMDGVSQESQGAGPYSQSQTFANPMRNVFLTAAELTMIIGYQPAAASHRYGNTTTGCPDGSYFATVYGTWP